LAHVESSNAKSAALTMLPFEVAPAAARQFELFVSGDCNWLEVNVVNEKIEVLKSDNIGFDSSLASLINNDEPRYLVVLSNSALILV
jgi:hypothetical protein